MKIKFHSKLFILNLNYYRLEFFKSLVLLLGKFKKNVAKVELLFLDLSHPLVCLKHVSNYLQYMSVEMLFNGYI